MRENSHEESTGVRRFPFDAETMRRPVPGGGTAGHQSAIAESLETTVLDVVVCGGTAMVVWGSAEAATAEFGVGLGLAALQLAVCGPKLLGDFASFFGFHEENKAIHKGMNLIDPAGLLGGSVAFFLIDQEKLYEGAAIGTFVSTMVGIPGSVADGTAGVLGMSDQIVEIGRMAYAVGERVKETQRLVERVRPKDFLARPKSFDGVKPDRGWKTDVPAETKPNPEGPETMVA